MGTIVVKDIEERRRKLTNAQKTKKMNRLCKLKMKNQCRMTTNADVVLRSAEMENDDFADDENIEERRTKKTPEEKARAKAANKAMKAAKRKAKKKRVNKEGRQKK